MTEKDLFREIGMIDEKYIEEASGVRKNKILTPMFRKALVTAACLCVCVGLYFGIQRLNGGNDAASESTNYEEANGRDDLFAAGKQESKAESDVASGESIEDFLDDMTGADMFVEEENASVSSTQNASVSEDVTADGSYEDEEIYLMQDATFRTMEERLAQYPEAFEEICETEAFVVVHGRVEKGLDKWEAFLEAIGAGEPASIDIVQFTVEGAPIITALSHDTKKYFIVVDATRDSWGQNSVWHEEYDCLNISEAQDGSVEVILGDVVGVEAETGVLELTNIYHLMEFTTQ